MANPGRRTKDARHVSFRMPSDVYDDYAAVAAMRGVDLSAVLNWVAVEYRPVLLLRRAEHLAAMLRAAAAGLPLKAEADESPGPGPREALGRVKALMDQLQGVAAKLSELVGGEERRQAG